MKDYVYFVSHSSKDEEIVLQFIDLLKNGLDIRKREIFCTSLDNALPPGEAFIPKMQKSIQECKVVFFIISKNYLDSKFCLAEMGAAWALNHNIIPIIIPPVRFSDLDDTPLKGIQILDLSSPDNVRQIFQKLIDLELVGTYAFSDFVEGCEKFSESISLLLKNVLKPDKAGFYEATIQEVFILNNELKHEFYLIDGKIPLSDTHMEPDVEYHDNETHWLANWSGKTFDTGRLKEGDRVRFKVSKIYSFEKDGVKHGNKIVFSRNINCSEIEKINK